MSDYRFLQFSDAFGKPVKDIFDVDYNRYQFSISAPLKLITQQVGGGREDATINGSRSQISTHLTITTASPSMRMRSTVFLQYPYRNDPNMILLQPQVRFFNRYLAVALSVPRLQILPSNRNQSVPLNGHSELQLFATLGTTNLDFGISNFEFGMGTTYDTSARTFSEFEAGINMTKPNSEASVVLKNKGDMLSATYLRYFGRQREFSIAAMVSRRFSLKQTTLKVGGAWNMNDQTTMKATFENLRYVGAILKHQIKPNVNLRVSAEFDTRAPDKGPAVGLALSLAL